MLLGIRLDRGVVAAELALDRDRQGVERPREERDARTASLAERARALTREVEEETGRRIVLRVERDPEAKILAVHRCAGSRPRPGDLREHAEGAREDGRVELTARRRSMEAEGGGHPGAP